MKPDKMHTGLFDEIRAAAKAADIDKLKECAFEIERRQLGSKTFDPLFLRMILDLLAETDVLALEDAGPILAPLEFDADKLTAVQRRMVVERLEGTYPRFADRMAQFYITEFVGRKFADDNALRLFINLSALEDEQARAFIAHGFEHIVCAGNTTVATSAFEHLRGLIDDSSIVVVTEAILSLARIVGHGGAFAAQAAELLRSVATDFSEPVRSVARTLVERIR